MYLALFVHRRHPRTHCSRSRLPHRRTTRCSHRRSLVPYDPRSNLQYNFHTGRHSLRIGDPKRRCSNRGPEHRHTQRLQGHYTLGCHLEYSNCLCNPHNPQRKRRTFPTDHKHRFHNILRDNPQRRNMNLRIPHTRHHHSNPSTFQPQSLRSPGPTSLRNRRDRHCIHRIPKQSPSTPENRLLRNSPRCTYRTLRPFLHKPDSKPQNSIREVPHRHNR